MTRTTLSCLTLATSALALGLGASHAAAANYLDMTFDEAAPDSTAYGYAYNGAGWAHNVVGGVGVDETIAMRGTADASDVPAGNNWGAVWEAKQTKTVPVDYADISELIYSADFAATGFADGATTTNIRYDVTFKGGSEILLRVRNNHAFEAVEGYQTVAYNLSEATIIGGSAAALLAYTGPIETGIKADFNGGRTGFGNDADNVFFMDNIYVGTVRIERLPGDANNDGTVDVVDLGILADNFRAAVTGGMDEADFNEDGTVDVVDLGILADNFRRVAGEASLAELLPAYNLEAYVAAVPEPTSLALLGVGGLLLGRRSRRA